jgi:ferredoxin--NADP+ reductase
MERLLAKRNVRAVSYDEWQRIDAAEVASASGPAPRRKFTTLREMLAVLDGADRDRSTG